MTRHIDKILLHDIIASFYPKLECDSNNKINKALYIIMSNSIQAVNFINAIEDEFDIEIEDDDISLNIFLDIETLIKVITKLTNT